MLNLGVPNKNESLSVDARQELDLRIGCAFTRFQTRFFQGKYGDLDSTLVSYGPCQTPTLTFCVDRMDKIKSFKPETFWYLELELEQPHAAAAAADNNKATFIAKWSRVHLFDRDVCAMFYSDLKQAKHATVTDVSLQQKTKQRPTALNTVELLRAASTGLSMSPIHAMQIAERLYTQGFISYPRTETTQYPPNFDLKQVLNQQTKSPSWGPFVKDLLFNKGMQHPRKGTVGGCLHLFLYKYIVLGCYFWINKKRTLVTIHP
jgi:DNA topoisomerase-3